MIVIGTEVVERYFVAHAGDKGIRAGRSQYDVWLAIAGLALWRNPEDVKASHPRASILKGGRVVFNIKGSVAVSSGCRGDPVLRKPCRV
jgi:mRNA interferase HigB